MPKPARSHRRRRNRLWTWPTRVSDEAPGSLLAFSATAVVVGALTGLVAGSFGLALDALALGREAMVHWAHGRPVLGFLLVVAICAAATAAAASLVHRFEPHAEGSGIPRVEGVVEGRIPPGSPRILPVKYAGGLLAIGAGLALGREGPSVQMGGNVAIIVSKVLRRNLDDLRVLVAAGAAAGLATAFNAPIAGGVFVLEELLRRFDPRTTIATLLASGAGFASSQLVLGDFRFVFTVGHLLDPRPIQAPIVLLVGFACGLAGVGYNKLVMGSLALADSSRIPRELRAAAIGAGVGIIAYVAPHLVGGGDLLTQRALLGNGAISVVIGVLAVRVVLGVVSYAAGTPGGLFAPMLVVGSHVGLLIGILAHLVAPQYAPEPAAMALVGLAAFFTSSVRAPITGIVLATELTGSTNQLPPMLGACAVAMVVASAMRSEPIYDALTSRAAKAAALNRAGNEVATP